MPAPRSPLLPSLAAVALAAALALPGCGAGSEPNAAAALPTLYIVSPKMDQTLDGGDHVEVMFDLRNYEVGKMDDGKNGQHVHLIVDNEPYAAVYDASKAVKVDAKLMTEGTHVIRAFPSAGPKDEKGAVHHESRKNKGAFAWVRFHVKKKGGPLASFDGSRPLLTYSRPKGTGATAYKVGSPEQKHFLIDFYLSNVTLSKGETVVRATYDGKSLPDFVEWKPYFLDELLHEVPGVGEHTMKLELLAADGKPVDGPFNVTERKFSVVEPK
jgi:hypothetical protein